VHAYPPYSTPIYGLAERAEVGVGMNVLENGHTHQERACEVHEIDGLVASIQIKFSTVAV
jgi:hypothetical protein